MKIIKNQNIKIQNYFDDSILNVDCLEISLKSRQFCNLTSINFSNIDSDEEFKKRAWAATIIGTLQAGYTDFHYLSSKWKENTENDALLGVSLTGIGDNKNYKNFNWTEITEYINKVNKETSEKIGIKKAARITAIKPEGCFVFDTKVKTNIGDKTLLEIFNLNGYKMDDISNLENQFYDQTQDVFIYNQNNELERVTKLYVNGYSKVYEIQFDDDTIIKCTEKHKFLTKNRGWVQASDLTDYDILKTYNFHYYNNIKSKRLLDDKEFTLDLETETTHTYQLVNGVVTHNTTSTALGTASGIHARFAPYYIRRVRYNKNEPIAQYLLNNIPDLVEEEFGNPNGVVVSIPQKSPDNSIFRDETALDSLERVKFFHENWIKPCHHTGANTHNVSCTINIKSNEWNKVREWMWNNKEYYSGISVFPYDGGSYVQAPFQECTKEEYERLLPFIKDIDLRNVIEDYDGTDLKGELACAGNSCDIV